MLRLLAAAAVALTAASPTLAQAPETDPRLLEVVDLYTGMGGTVDDPRAHDLLVAVAADGGPLAQMWLARCYSRGRMLFDRDADRARAIADGVIDEVTNLAARDSAEAAFLVATAYAEGLGMPTDQAMAIAWYHRAADLGNALAQHNLGNAYRAGDGVVRDDGLAAYWYRRAAEQGDALPGFWLGQMYERGEGVEMDLELAERWYADAAGRGNARAIEALERLRAR